LPKSQSNTKLEQTIA